MKGLRLNLDVNGRDSQTLRAVTKCSQRNTFLVETFAQHLHGTSSDEAVEPARGRKLSETGLRSEGKGMYKI